MLTIKCISDKPCFICGKHDHTADVSFADKTVPRGSVHGARVRKTEAGETREGTGPNRGDYKPLIADQFPTAQKRQKR